MARLVWLYPAGPELAKEFALVGHPVVLGRGDECAIRIESTSLSRQHARIRDNGDARVVEDLGSTNGTYVNEAKVDRSVLHDADQIRLGGVSLRFHVVGASDAGPDSSDDRGGSGTPAELAVRRARTKN